MIYPEHLPTGLISNNSHTDKPNYFSGLNHAGAPIIRRSDADGFRRFSVSFSFNEIEMRQFVSFFNISIINGSQTFDIKLRDLNDYLGLYRVYFDSQYSVNLVGRRYSVSASVVGVFLSRVYPDALPVPPDPQPFTWSSENKTSDDFIEKIDSGTILIKQLNTDQSIPLRAISTESFDLMEAYLGKLYLEFGVSSHTSSWQNRDINLRLHRQYEVSSYESTGAIFDYPQVNMIHRDSFGNKSMRFNSQDSSSAGGFPFDTSIAGDPVIMMALDFTVDGNIRLWVGTNGTWLNSGNPATGANPSKTLPGYGISWEASSLFLSLDSSHTFSNAGPASVTYRIYGNADHGFNYSIPSGFNGT